MISSNLKSQIEKANNNVFISKEISNLFEKEEIKTSTLNLLITNKKSKLSFDVCKVLSKKKYYKIKILATKSQIKDLFSFDIKNLFLSIKDYNILSLNVVSPILEYSISKKDINSYIVSLKIKKES